MSNDKISRYDRLVQQGFEMKAASVGLTPAEVIAHIQHMIRLEIIQNGAKK